MEYNLLDIVWTMIAACLVYFMQAGFAMVCLLYTSDAADE